MMLKRVAMIATILLIAALGLTDPAAAAITDQATDQPAPLSVGDGNIVLSLLLEPWQTRVLRVKGGETPPTPIPTPSATPSATPSPTPTPTATPSPCADDANAMGGATCLLYLPFIVYDLSPSQVATPTPSPTPTPAVAQELLSWLQDLPNRDTERLISGQHLGFGEGVEQGYQKYVVELYAQTGKGVGMVGVDFGYGRRWDESQGYWDLIGKTNPVLISHWNRGGLVTVSWHAPNPWTRKSAWDKGPDDDLTALVDPTNPMNAVWEADLDRVAVALKDLQDAGVVVLWRPFHENTGGWF